MCRCVDRWEMHDLGSEGESDSTVKRLALRRSAWCNLDQVARERTMGDEKACDTAERQGKREDEEAKAVTYIYWRKTNKHQASQQQIRHDRQCEARKQMQEGVKSSGI